jgi:hypothetical protein
VERLIFVSTTRVRGLTHHASAASDEVAGWRMSSCAARMAEQKAYSARVHFLRHIVPGDILRNKQCVLILSGLYGD